MKSALVILLDREGQVQARERVTAGTVELLEKQIACAVRRMSHDRLCVGDTISVLDGEVNESMAVTNQ
jgi:hypothetical protein